MNISAYRANYLPLLGQLMNQMKLPQIINEAVTKLNSQAIVDAGTFISGMILNPWKPDIVPSNFTEERSGNVLDEFYRQG